jgi:hypothetical protein
LATEWGLAFARLAPFEYDVNGSECQAKPRLKRASWKTEWNERGKIMERETILYISDLTTSSNSTLAALKANDYDVVSTNSSTQALALLFVMHSVVGVVLNQWAREQASFHVARSLRAIRPDVPILLLCHDQIDRLPSCVDACVSTGQPLEKLASVVRRLFAASQPGTPLADPAHSVA